MKKHYIFFALASIASCKLTATDLLYGNALSALSSNPASTTLSFSQRVTAKAFDNATGTIFLGLANDPDTTNNAATNLKTAPGAYIISKMSRQPGTSSFQAVPMINNSALQNTQIDFLAVSTYPGNIAPNLIFGAGAAGESVINAISYNMLITQQSPPLLGYIAIHGANGAPTTGVLNIAANQNTAFVITGSRTTDNTQVKDIAVVSIADQTLQLEQQAAVPADPGIKAQLLDPSNSVPSAVTIDGITSTTQDLASIYWDEPLQRLYVGLQLVTSKDGSGVAGNGGRSVVMGYTNADKNLFLEKFVPDAAVVNGNQTNIVAARQAATPLTIAAAQLNVLHASTGPSYLIVHGGNGSISYYDYAANADNPTPHLDGTTGNTIWAIPLVDKQDPTDATQGVQANKNAFNTATKVFDTPAAVNADLTNTSDLFAMVGAGPLPVDPETPIWGFGGGTIKDGSKTVVIGQNTLDIQIVGDTVYVAIGTAQTTDDDSGVYYSQALFDQDGKILQWTPWAKRAFPYSAFLDTPQPTSAVRYIAIDPVIGKIWANDANLGQTVRISSWQQNPRMSTLAQAANTQLSTGAFSVLDLDSSTVGFNGNTASRYTIFGGAGKVLFMRSALANTVASDSPQTPVTNFASPANILETTLSGGVTALEYSRNSTVNSNYFFAGTAGGLWVFSDSGNGFSVASLDALDAAPFSTGSWQNINTIPGSVVDIKSIGNALYVLYVENVNAKQPTYKLYRLSYATTVSALVGSATLLAQSNTGSLANTLAFYAIQVIATDETASEEQVVLATNNGLFQTTKAGGSQTATNQATAGWQLVSPSGSTLFSNLFTDIAGVDAPIPSMAWPISLQDPTGEKIYNKGMVSQLVGGLDGGGAGAFQLLPTQFNALNDTQFQNINPIDNFWSDGGRRFFVLQSSTPPLVSQILSSPYNVLAYRDTRPGFMTDPIFSTAGTLYWLQQIGATGILLGGTNTGIVALE